MSIQIIKTNQSKFISSLKWTTSSVLINLLMQLIVLSTLARLLSPDDFGLIALVLSLLAIFNVFNQTAFAPALIFIDRATKYHQTASIIISVIIGFASCLVVLITVQLILLNESSTYDIKLIIVVISLSLLFESFGATSLNMVKRNLGFKKIALRNILSYAIAYVFISLPMAINGFGYYSLLVAILIQSAINNAFLIITQPIRISLNKKRVFVALQDMKKFAFGNLFASLFSRASTQIDNVIVSSMMGLGAAGWYSQSYRILSFPANLFGEIVAKILFPYFSKLKSDRDRLRYFLTAFDKYGMMLLILMSLLVYLYAKELIMVLLGIKWVDIVVFVQILVFALPFRIAYKIDYELLKSFGNVRFLVISQSISLALIIASALTGAYFDSLTLVCLLVVCSVFINYVMLKICVLKLLNISIATFFTTFVFILLFASFFLIFSLNFIMPSISNIWLEFLSIFGLFSIYLFGLIIAYNKSLWLRR
jgi:O-antigen/teichoic acid export membrane protein